MIWHCVSLLCRLILAIAVVLLAACSMERKEVAREPSPNGEVVALIVEEMGGGAAGVRVLEAYLVEATDSADISSKSLDEPLVVASSCDSFAVEWQDNDTLLVLYDSECYISHFKNYWLSERTLASYRGNSGRILPRTELVPKRMPVVAMPNTP